MSRVYLAGKVGIQAYDMNLQTGALTPLGKMVDDDGAGSFIAVSPDGKFLYSIAKPGAATLSIDQSTGQLTYLNSVKLDISGNSHITIASHGESAVVIAAAYGGGGVNITKIGKDGLLEDAASGTAKKHTGGSNVYQPARGNEQEAAHPHQCVVDQSAKWALVSDLGQDKVYVYGIDLATGTLNEHSVVNTAPGAGPRHMCFHPSYRYVYGVNELDCTVNVYEFSPEGEVILSNTLQTISTLPEGYNNRDHRNAKNANGDPATGPNRPEQTNATADIRITPDGRFLYASNRGHDSLVCYSVGSNGLLTLENFTYTRGAHPRNFNIHPSGEWLLVANQDSDNVVVFKLWSATGQLTYADCEVNIKAARCVDFSPIDSSKSNCGLCGCEIA